MRKVLLIENAVGANDYENISDWEQLKEAADNEQFYARDKDRIQVLARWKTI